MATIEKRGPYQYRAKVRRKGQAPVSKTFNSRKEAEVWARAMESEMDRGIYVSRSEAEKTTLNEAIDRYIDEYIPNLKHSMRERQRANHLKNYNIMKLSLAAIKGKEIKSFIDSRKKEGVGNNTVRLDLALLSRLFEVASKDWGMECLSNPVKKVSKPKPSQGRDRRISKDEEEKLINCSNSKFKHVLVFALETGMRRGEIERLTWENVSFSKKIAHLPETKNGEARSVPLSPKAVETLKSLFNDKVIPIQGSVFKMTGSAMGQAMRKSCRKVGLEDLRFHDLRHEAISRFFEETDLDVMEIKTITGHKSMQMLARYSHLRTSRLAERLAGSKRGGSQ